MAGRPAKQAQGEPPETPRRALAVGVALAIVTIAVYARVAGNGFINLDDGDYVTQNPRVLAGITWSGIVWAFTTGHAANWHPLTWLSHMLDCQLFGLNPMGHHLTSLALHVASTLLLFQLFRKMTGSLWPSAFVAAVFGLHPLHVESVAWVAERKDVLAALFWILTTLAYVNWVEKRGTGRYLGVVGLFALGLLAKPMLVTLPFTLLLLDLWPLRRWENSRSLVPLVREKIPLFLLVVASSAITFLVQQAHGAVGSGVRLAPGSPVENAVVAYAAYLAKSFAPARLLVYYPYPDQGYSGFQVAWAEILLAVITLVAWFERRRRPWIVVGWLWFLGTLFPVIGIVQVGSQAMADRYSYVPMIGLSFAVAFSAVEIARRPGIARILVSALFLVAVAAWSGLTWKQTGYWKDDRTLFAHVVDVMPENHLGHGILGNTNLREKRYDEAIANYREALRLQPGYIEGYANMGQALELSGRSPEALSLYQAALQWSPDMAEAHEGLGRILANQGQPEPAIAHFEAALRSRPDLLDARVNLGITLLRTKRVDAAIAQFEKVLEIDPGNVAARRELAAARSGR